MADETNPWTTLSSTRVYETSWITVIEHQVRDAAGHDSPYGVVHFKQIGLKILALDDRGRIPLVGQYRYPAGYFSWELPAGGGDAGEAPRRAAERELREETGLTARNWLELIRLVPSGSVTDQRELCFLAWDLESGERDLDEQEVIRVRRVPFGEALRMAMGGGIMDSGSVAAIVTAHLKALRGELPEDVADRLR